jgi:hypothetical protein
MEEGSKNWITTCAIGCILLAVFVCLLVLAGYFGVKRMIHTAEETTAGLHSLTESFGRMSEFTPDPSGTVPAERIATFLRVRERCQPQRSTLEAVLAQLGGPAPGDGGTTVIGTVRSLRAGFSIVPQMIGYVNARNEALLAETMGLGEYLHLYTLIYASWLEKPVDDGPPFMVVGGEVRIGTSEVDVRSQRETEIRRRLNRLTIPMVRNQLEALTADEAADDPEWAESLRTELLLLESNVERLPWQDGLPPRTAESFEPFLDDLQASYSALCHPVELAVIQ